LRHSPVGPHDQAACDGQYSIPYGLENGTGKPPRHMQERADARGARPHIRNHRDDRRTARGAPPKGNPEKLLADRVGSLSAAPLQIPEAYARYPAGHVISARTE